MTVAYHCHDQLNLIKTTISEEIIGSEDSIELLLISLLAKGHVLIEGEPGLGKSSLASALAKSIDASFARIQFTADLMPADIIGYSMYRHEQQSFEFIKGPVFNNIILADEINRTSPRVQSALLEAMNEKQVSVDGITHILDKTFMVIATQNSLSSAGTFPLPNAQLDRFLVSIPVKLPSEEQQLEIINLHLSGTKKNRISDLLSQQQLFDLQDEVSEVTVSKSITKYVVELCTVIRKDPLLEGSISIRATLGLTKSLQALALLRKRDAVYPEDVKYLLPYCFAHRLTYKKDASHDGCFNYLQKVCLKVTSP